MHQIYYCVFQFFFGYIFFYLVFLGSISTLVLVNHSPMFQLTEQYSSYLLQILCPIITAALVILVLKHVFLVIYSWNLYIRYWIHNDVIFSIIDLNANLITISILVSISFKCRIQCVWDIHHDCVHIVYHHSLNCRCFNCWCSSWCHFNIFCVVQFYFIVGKITSYWHIHSGTLNA